MTGFSADEHSMPRCLPPVHHQHAPANLDWHSNRANPALGNALTRQTSALHLLDSCCPWPHWPITTILSSPSPFFLSSHPVP
ncbi:hypothetical protein M3J09_002171 [Ascochyta lentis]